MLFPRLLPNLFLCDVTDGAGQGEAGRFVYRLTGTGIDRALGANGTGRPAADLPIADAANSCWHQFARTVDEGRPTYLEHAFIAGGDRMVHYRRLLLPLGRGSERIDQLLGMLVFLKAWERLPETVPS